MSPKPIIEIKEGAFFISDAHYSSRRPKLLDFLKAIQNKELNPSQIIFMGDIFDALFGLVPKTYESNQQVIDIINELSHDLEILYLEGNHDFNLKSVFPKLQVFSIQNQPVSCKHATYSILLAHGDFVGTPLYKIYTKIVRNPFVVYSLNLINILLQNRILEKLNEYLSKKQDCTEIQGFEKIISNRLNGKFKCNYLIEGHFHQNKSLEFNTFKYINLAAFACNQRYFIVKSSHEELLIEKIFSKEK